MSDDRRPLLSLCIVSWNDRELMRACLAALRDHPYSGESEVIVVDNNSTDGGPDVPAADFPEVRLISNEENLGFPRACNQAIRASGGEVVVLLNPDAEVGPGALDALTDLITTRPEAGAAGAKLLNPDGSVQPECRRDFPNLAADFLLLTTIYKFLPDPTIIWRWRLPAELPDGPAETFAVSGACMAVRREALDAVGLLDEASFMHLEDIDLCYRLRRTGWKVLFHPGACVTHHGMGSARKVLGRMRSIHYEARYRFYRKHLGRARAEALRALIFAAMAVRLSLLAPLTPLRSGAARRRHVDRLREYGRALAWSLTRRSQRVP